ncbi:nitrite reductase small subunit NirD [Acanthopleuribacter pedis]|uniref:Nitrite reductase small subunit NirD n=1 Tax=Acanthopleuribacter pedis TaxID=442870 RepID=A0A8J7U5M6_9BACT|nr:nitrite reductase small subunit NirD [Acanthopleuribacter pedis]MBO1321872.1 nitrite reductase small subunit NirD [Acanthopleuribacter pedis]
MVYWFSLGSLDHFPRQGARVLSLPEVKVAVFRTHDDGLFALEDRCPHRGGPLSEGMIHGMRVHCPLHGQAVALDTGTMVYPDEGCVRTFPVKVVDGNVLIELPTAPVSSQATTAVSAV